MKIRDILAKNEPTLSFEVFPPKTEDKYESVEAAASEIAKLNPAFMSVTYGAGGGTSQYTVDIAASLKAKGVTPLAHLTCVSSTREKVHSVLEQLKAEGIENVLALRGDIPKDGKVENDYRYASELIAEIKASGDFCIGAACYPEGHVESVNKTEDIQHLKEKVEAGCDFITTQMFFDNEKFFSFVDRCRAAGITVPIVPGLKPISKASQLTLLPRVFHVDIPDMLVREIVKCKDDSQVKQVGIDWCTAQSLELKAKGVPSIHYYSLMAVDSVYQVAKSVY